MEDRKNKTKDGGENGQGKNRSEENSNKKPPMNNCPTCEKLIEYDVKNPYRPFCSRGCQAKDLIDWADEKNII